MAHFAKLDENNKVIDVIVVDNNEILDDNNIEREQLGLAFCITLTRHLYWKQTSYNSKFRKNFAKIGSTYDPVKDMFIDEQPYPSWTLNTETGKYEPPVPKPVQPIDHYSNPGYTWDESTLSWIDCSYKTDGYFIKPTNL